LTSDQCPVSNGNNQDWVFETFSILVHMKNCARRFAVLCAGGNCHRRAIPSPSRSSLVLDLCFHRLANRFEPHAVPSCVRLVASFRLQAVAVSSRSFQFSSLADVREARGRAPVNDRVLQ